MSQGSYETEYRRGDIRKEMTLQLVINLYLISIRI